MKSKKPGLSPMDDLLLFVTEFLEKNKAGNITAIKVDDNFSEFENIVIASGSSTRQVVALSEKLKEEVKKSFDKKCNIEGKDNADWVLLDFGDLIVHIFKPEVREYYQIEKIWKRYITKYQAEF